MWNTAKVLAYTQLPELTVWRDFALRTAKAGDDRNRRTAYAVIDGAVEDVRWSATGLVWKLWSEQVIRVMTLDMIYRAWRRLHGWSCGSEETAGVST